MTKIQENVFLDTLDDNYGFVIVTIDFIYFENNNEKIIPNLKAFIDTGANQSILNRKHLKTLGIEYDDIQDTTIKKGFNGKSEVKLLSDVGIRIHKLFDEGECSTLNEIAVSDLSDFDVAIGTDILRDYELIYNGHSQTFILKVTR